MSSRAHGDPDPPLPQSPYTWEDADYVGNKIQIVVAFDNSTRVIIDGTTYRDADCMFKKILVGLGGDGRPDSSGHVFTCPQGSHNVPGAVFAAQGFDTIEQFMAMQITAGA